MTRRSFIRRKISRQKVSLQNLEHRLKVLSSSNSFNEKLLLLKKSKKYRNIPLNRVKSAIYDYKKQILNEIIILKSLIKAKE